MMQKGLWLFIFLSLILIFPSFLLSSGHYQVLDGPKDLYFGHISYVEIKNDSKDPQVWREGETTPEIADLNLPIGPGDRICTSDVRRCEIQFDNGTVIRLDLNTELKIETIMAQALSSWNKMSNLVLSRGGIYIMYKKYNSREVFQVITRNAAVKLTHETVAMVSLNEDRGTDVQVKHGKVYVLFGPDAEHLKDVTVKKLEKVTIYKDHQFARLNYVENTDFETWNKAINENFNKLHKGKNFLPKPILKYPEAVVNFAMKYSNFGEWLWDDLYGYVWRPLNLDSYFFTRTWQPYVFGRWTEINNELFWVPKEPWGWVPYHLGFWVWDKNKGWFWIPGSIFASSWADFYCYGDYFGWQAWWPWNIYLYHFSYLSYPYWRWQSLPSLYDYYDYYYMLFYWKNYASVSPGKDKTLYAVKISQLKKPPKVNLPKEMERLRDKIYNALKNGDRRVLASLEAIPRMLVLVKSEDLNARRIHEKVTRLDQLAKKGEFPFPSKKDQALPPSQNAYERAVGTFIRNNIVSRIRGHVISSFNFNPRNETSKAPVGPRLIYESFQSVLPAPALRFRDWNPDIRVARDLHVSITYSSRDNEVRCPQLNISSRDVSMPGRSGSFHGGGRSFSSSSSGYSSSSSSSSSSGSSSSNVGSSSHSSGSSSGHSSGRGSEKK